ncbi:MAG: dihydroxy-acid dehydratase, partial [Pseudoflavonifractor sp.]
KTPLIGIANTYGETISGHIVFKELVDHVRRGIYRAGGSTAEFGTIACCDGMTNSNAGAHFSLPSREIIADSVECMVRAHKFDGLVIMASCDKIVPGCLMAAARLNIPTIVIQGGPMTSGILFHGKKSHIGCGSVAKGEFTRGLISQQELDDYTTTFCPTCGSCQFYGTANTMSSMAESLGMALPGSALIPAVYNERRRVAFQTGEAIVELVKKGITAKQIMTADALENAARVLLASGGSTNAVLHLTAIYHTLGFDSKAFLQNFNHVSDDTPRIVNVVPSTGAYDCEDFYLAGGIPRVMQNLGDKIHLNALTCTGKTVGENLEEYHYLYPENTEVIRPIDNPFETGGSLVILHGNLAPGSAVAKPGSIPMHMRKFTGKAKVYESEDRAKKGIFGGEIEPGTVVIIRNEGPKGGPGMREMAVCLKALEGMGLGDSCALITDGRFAGMNGGCFVCHITPESALGGPLAVVHDGDMIDIDFDEKRTINVRVSDEELAERLKHWTYVPQQEIDSSFLRRYVASVKSVEFGGTLD